MAQTIKSLIAPLIMMAVLALLPACWGLKRPAPVTGTIGSSCATNPFNESCDETYAIARVLKISECIADGAAATPTCTDAVNANPCLRDPFAEACETDPTFVAYIDRARSARATYCQLETADSTLCTGAAGSVQFDMACLDSPTGSPMHVSCTTRPSVVRICTDAPFTRTGCGNIPTIETLRIAHCEDSATAWDDGCVEATYTVATAARDTACLTHGIDATAGGHADCAERGNVLAACTLTSPFAYIVCDAVEDIDMERTTFCLNTTDNGGENPFHVRCEQDTHGDVRMAQEASCLANVSTDDGCVALITPTCTDTPLAGVSCAGLDGYSGFLDAFCAKDNNAMLGECAMTPATLCPADPFGDMVTAGDGVIDCLADEDYDSDRQALCASGMEGTGECDTAVIAPAVCASSGDNANPFAGFCSSTNNIGGGDITAIRQTTLTACTANASTPVCMNASGAIATLNADCMSIGETFKDRCDYDEYDDERTGFCTTNRDTAWNSECNNNAHGNPTEARGQACVRYGTGENGDSSCTTNDFAKNFCEENDPFATGNAGCEELTDFLEVVQTYCDANATEESCKANYADWNGSFTGNDVLATAPVSTHTTNQFLSGLTATSTVPTTDFTEFLTTDDPVKANASPHLNLADTEHGFGGEAEDGVMFFGGTFISNSEVRYYAGIYSSTDLGAPLTDASKTGVWEAWMRTSGKDPKNEAFTLMVNFDTSTKAGTLSAFFQSTSGTNTELSYDIKGTFNIHGVIGGNIAVGTEDSNNIGSLDTTDNEYTLGDLTGLIGARGVVAAFVSNTETTSATDELNPFFGGFVGVPLAVTYADWDVVASPDAALDAPIANQFLQDIATNGGGGETSVNLKDATYSSNPLNGDVADGFAYKMAGTSPDFVYYVGLLPSTDLGLPLDMTTAMGTWNGSFISIEDGAAAQPADFTLTVTYGGAGAGYEGSVSATIADTLYSLEGKFDARGVIDGTVTRTVITPASTSMGTLQGLIGSGGAVGVFISNAGEGVDYGGGFVARKQP